MVYIIDRIENGIAVCECMESGSMLEIAIANLPKGVSEGDAIRGDDGSYILDSAMTKQRKTEMANRLDRLFKKHNP
jgi:hypothetical protein